MKIETDIDFGKITINPKISFINVNYISKEMAINPKPNHLGHSLFLKWSIFDYDDHVAYNSNYYQYSKTGQQHGPNISFNY
jgi:hypothetical protein